MISRRGLIIGVAAAGLILPANAAFLPISSAMYNALDYGVTGDGVTNDTAAIQSFITFCNSKKAIAFFPGVNYSMGNTGVVVPNNSTIFCGQNATFIRNVASPSYAAVQTKANLMWALGSNCRFYNGTLNKTVGSALTNSSSSVVIGLGSKTFTVGASLGITNGDFMRCWSASGPINYVEGTVTAYSGTTLTINATFSGGSGTKTDWIIDWEGVYQTPISFNNCDSSIVDGVTLSGIWYEGFLYDGENLGGGTSLICSNNIIRNSTAIGILNRAFDIYGNVAHCKLHGSHVDGQNGTTDYGINCNAANNPSNQGQTVIDFVISDCTINRTQFQGVAMGDSSLHNTISNTIVDTVLNIAGVGFELVYANGNPPQFNTITGCVAQGCGGQGFGVFGTNYQTITGCSAFSCGDGFKVDASVVNSQENNLLDIMAVGCTTGVNLGTGSSNTYVSGRSTANTTNLTNAGSGSNTANLITI